MESGGVHPHLSDVAFNVITLRFPRPAIPVDGRVCGPQIRFRLCEEEMSLVPCGASRLGSTVFQPASYFCINKADLSWVLKEHQRQERATSF